MKSQTYVELKEYLSGYKMIATDREESYSMRREAFARILSVVSEIQLRELAAESYVMGARKGQDKKILIDNAVEVLDGCNHDLTNDPETREDAEYIVDLYGKWEE